MTPSSLNQGRIAVMWFRDDLRLHDHRALTAASEHGSVVGLVVDEDAVATGSRALGAASSWWRERSLHALRDDLWSHHGVRLIRLRGNPVELVPRVAQLIGATLVTWTRRYYAPLMNVDAQIKTHLTEQGIEAHSFPGFTLTEPWEVQKKDGGDYRVYTPYSKAARGVVNDAPPLPVPELHGAALESRDFEELESAVVDWPDCPEEIHWAGGLSEMWSPGEAGARERLADFLDATPGYKDYRDVPSVPATSRLSPYLRFGEISPREVYLAAGELNDEDADTFRKELL